MSDFQAWHCGRNEALFCPEEGCPKGYCAREHGWLLGQPSPDRCTGIIPDAAPPETPAAICPICRNEMTIVPMDCPRCDGYGRDARSEGWTDEVREAVNELEEKFNIAVCSADHNDRTHARADAAEAAAREAKANEDSIVRFTMPAILRRAERAEARCDNYRKTLKEVQATLSDDYSNREYITRLIDAALEKGQSNA